MWRIWWAPNKARKWQMTFNSAFKGLNKLMHKRFVLKYVYFMPLYVSSTCAHHQEVKISLRSLWYHQTYRWPSRAQVERGHVEAWNKLIVKQKFCSSSWLITEINHYNIKNSTNLATDVTKLELNQNQELLTHDVKDLYVNIPIEDTLTITNSMLLKSNDAQTTQMLIILLKLLHYTTSVIITLIGAILISWWRAHSARNM